MFDFLKGLLELAAIILSIVNAIMLLRQYVRDKPILKVSPVHPDVYQWWFRLPNGVYNGLPTRAYGFLLYADIANRGLRKVSIESWTLRIHMGASRHKLELKALSIPEPVANIAGYPKTYRVLGLPETVVDAGCSLAGFAYYRTELYGDDSWDPVIQNDRIKGTLVVQDIFGKKASTEITFAQQTLEYVQQLIPSIEQLK